MAVIDLRNCELTVRDGLAGTAVAAKKTNEVQTITFTDVTGGTWTAAYGAAESGALAWNITPAQLQSALEGLATVGEDNVSVSGTAGESYVVTFVGTLGETDLDLIVLDDTNITGGAGVNTAIAETVAGGVGTAPVQTNATLTIETVVLNTDVTDLVPVGARFTIAGETAAATVHTVTVRTPSAAGPTTQITFTPALGAGSYSTGAALTFTYQQTVVKIGEGELKYSESSEYAYRLDRGQLNTVSAGNEVPMDVSISCLLEQIRSGTGEVVTPMEAITRRYAASEWVSSSADTCEPYAVDLVVVDTRPCGDVNSRTYVFPDFRSEKREPDFKTAVISVSGKCNATAPTITVG